GWFPPFHGLVLCLGFAVIGVMQTSALPPDAGSQAAARQPSSFLLPVWFLAAFVPMLRVFTEHIHFLYAVVPAAIILAREAEACWRALAAKTARDEGRGVRGEGREEWDEKEGARPGSPRAPSRSPLRECARYAFFAVVAVIVADQSMNLLGALRVNQATYGSIQTVAEWFKEHVPAGSLVVSNVIHAEEIKWHSGGYFENYWTVAGGVCDRS